MDKLDIEDQGAVGGNAGEATGAVGEVGGNGKTAFATNGHADDTNVPTLDDLALAGLEGERLTLLVGYCNLADVSDTNSVAALDSAAVANSSVVNGNALDNLDTGGRLGVLGLLGLLSSRTGRALLKVLGELNLLGVLLLLGSDSLALVVLELLLLLLGELSILLGDELVKASGLLSGALVLSLVGGNELGGLLLVSVDLLDTGVLKSIKVVASITVVTLKAVLELVGREIVFILVLGVLVILIIVHDVVSGQVDSVGTGDNKEDLLAVVDGDVERLLKGLHVLVVNLIILILEARKSTLDEAQGRARDGRDVALAIGLGLLEFRSPAGKTSGVANDAPATESDYGRTDTSQRIKSVVKAREINLQKQGTPWRQESRSRQAGPRGRKRDQAQQTL
ncbi:hypothetical protein HG531_001601 [Fusarium graminearum]|nr:hypothetical protein HG531_001601 [Fusarium graminearum]